MAVPTGCRRRAGRSRDRPGLHLVGGIGREEGRERVRLRFGLEPRVVLPVREDHWHPVVDRRRELVRGRGDDRAALEDGPVGRLAVLPDRPETGEGERELAPDLEEPGLLAPVDLLPLVEAGSRDQATPLLERVAERRLLGQCLAAGVDQAVADRPLPGPEGHQPPVNVSEFTATAVSKAHDRDLLRGRDVVARFEPRLLVDLEELGQDLARRRQQVAAAHPGSDLTARHGEVTESGRRGPTRGRPLNASSEERRRG